MIISRRFENLSSWDSPRSALEPDTASSNVPGLAWKMNICMESVNVLQAEGAPYRIQGGMRDIGLHLGVGWGIGEHDDQSDEMVHEDSGAESESERANLFAVSEDRFPSSEDGAVTIAEDGVVSVSVGLPRRFGNPVSSDEDPESQATETAAPDAGASPECTLNGSLREMLRKVTVNESILRSAIDNLGGGVMGLRAVVDYVKHFQETRDPNAGNINPDDFTRGLEQFCMLNGQRKEAPQNQSLNPGAPGTSDSETHQGAGVEQNQRPVSNLQIRAQEDWPCNGHADPFTMSYMESMSGYFPNFCYPYPPPFAGYGPFNMGVRPMYVPMMGVPYFPPPSHEYMPRTDAISRASRKSRIARRRGQGTDAHHTRPATKLAHVVGGGSSVPSGNQESTSHQNHAASSSGQVAQGLSSRDLMLILQKQLSPSGVSSLGRIVLPKKEAETHLPQLVASEGVLLAMTDYDTAQSWTFRYRFWSNNKSRMYLLENTRDFVKAHNLQERDMLSLYRDAQGSYVIRGEKNSANQTGDAANDSTAEDIPTEEDLPHKKQKI